MPRAAKSANTNVAAPTASPAKLMRDALNKLRASDKSLWVKNNTDAIIILRNDLRSQNRWQIELRPKSVAFLPKEALDEQPFQKLWMQLKVTVSDDEDMEEQLFLHLTGEIERKDAREAEAAAKLADPALNRDLVERTCLLTGVTVYQSRADIDAGVPPLADHVKDKAYLFPGEQRYDSETGKSYWVFPKVAIGMNGTTI